MTTRHYGATCNHGQWARSCYTCQLETRVRDLADALTQARDLHLLRWAWRGVAMGAGMLLAYLFTLGVDVIARAVIR